MDQQNNVITSPVKAIRAYCIDCMCGNTAEVRRCPLDSCPLFPFRFGKNPYWGQGKAALSEDDGCGDIDIAPNSEETLKVANTPGYRAQEENYEEETD